MFFIFPISADSAPEKIGGAQLLLPPIYEIFWSSIIILGLWLVLGAALPKIYKMLDARREEIDAGLDAAEKAKEDAALAQRERDDALRKAQEEAKQIRDQAHQDAGRIVAEAKQDAQDEAHQITEAASRQIETERKAAAVSLREDVGTLATDLAERIIGEQLQDQALSQRVIDRFMDQVEDDLKPTPVGADA